MTHAPSPVKHVLLDADGVLQRVAAGWEDQARPLVGERFREVVEALWIREAPALVGEADVVDALAASLADLGIEADAAQLYPRIWLRTEVFASTPELLRRLRGAGLGVHLGTNQTRLRSLHMRRTLGYDDLFDVSVYSCDIGLAKPDPRYFERALELIGAAPAEVLFVDDRPGNVASADGVGLATVHWHAELGLPELESRLAAAGVRLAS